MTQPLNDKFKAELDAILETHWPDDPVQKEPTPQEDDYLYWCIGLACVLVIFIAGAFICRWMPFLL